MKNECTIPATLDSLPQFESILLPLITDVDDETRSLLRLVIQELGTNIVIHAYKGTTGTIEASFHRTGSELSLEFRDFAPNHYEKRADISLPDAQSLPSGGWGLYIIHKGVDQIQYDPLPDGNRWKLYKLLNTREKYEA